MNPNIVEQKSAKKDESQSLSKRQLQDLSSSPLSPVNQAELLTITIDIGFGKQENIVVYANDDPNDLASDFAIRNGLNDKIKELLAIKIQSHID